MLNYTLITCSVYSIYLENRGPLVVSVTRIGETLALG